MTTTKATKLLIDILLILSAETTKLQSLSSIAILISLSLSHFSACRFNCKIMGIYRTVEKYYVSTQQHWLLIKLSSIYLFIYFSFLHFSLLSDSKFLRKSINNNIKTTRAVFYSQYYFQLHETTVKLDFQIKQQQI
jgi:hypothetical protein